MTRAWILAMLMAALRTGGAFEAARPAAVRRQGVDGHARAGPLLAVPGQTPATFAIGDAVRVIAEDLTFWHHPKHKKGLNPFGLIGVVSRLATVDRNADATLEISANYVLGVQFKDPKMVAHMNPEELERHEL